MDTSPREQLSVVERHNSLASEGWIIRAATDSYTLIPPHAFCAYHQLDYKLCYFPIHSQSLETAITVAEFMKSYYEMFHEKKALCDENEQKDENENRE